MNRAVVKRFLDVCKGSREFRDGLKHDPQPLLQKWNIDVDPEVLRGLWDDEHPDLTESEAPHPAVRDYLDWKASRLRFQQALRERAENGPSHFQNWRERQIRRFMTEATPEQSEAVGHWPFVLELARGCSVGCDYCGVAAGPLEAVARYTSENGVMFRTLLNVLGDYFGAAATTGFLYWATEPFDNLDYEKYLRVFFETFGTTPQTTTAAWQRNVNRTRRLLDQSRRDNGVMNRFSINSLEQLRFCMETFTPEELDDVELITQTPGSQMVQVAAGRGIEANPMAVRGTIACVTGFLINLVDHSIKLISPCTDLKRWPLGYAIYRQAQFETADDVHEFLKACERDIMSVPLDDATVPCLREDLKVEVQPPPKQFVLKTEFGELSFSDTVQIAILKAVDGVRSVGKIVRDLMNDYDPAVLYYTLGHLHQDGLFETLPDPAALDQPPLPGGPDAGPPGIIMSGNA